LLERRSILRPKDMSRRERLSRYLLAYLMLASIIVVGFVVLVIIWPQSVLNIIAMLFDVTDVDVRYAGTFVYLIAGILLLIMLFVTIMVGEPYLRKGAEMGQLRRRYLRIIIPMVIFGLLGLVFWILPLL